MISVPDLNAKNALDFTYNICNYHVTEGEEFDFANVKNCDPFPMLVVSSAIRQLLRHSNIQQCKALNMQNSYAEHMRFYNAVGTKKGRGFAEDYGNSRYLPITRLRIDDLRKQGAENLERIQEVIENKSKLMANVLAQGNESYKKWISYALTEIMRNIPEHSRAKEIWYCAQYWPTFDLVELAILDEGIGIRESLLSNSAYDELIANDEDALLLALRPGISRTFLPGGYNLSNDDWANSGYGLYMVSRTCAALAGDFIIASGDTAIKVSGNTVNIYKRGCHIKGTAIRLRVHLREMVNYEEIVKRILKDGEENARINNNTIKSASKSSKRILG